MSDAKIIIFILSFAAALFFSCAGVPPVTEPLSEKPPEQLLPDDKPAPHTALETALDLVHENSGSVVKTYTLDENGNPVVHARLTAEDAATGESSHFEVMYDLRNISAVETGGYRIPFAVQSVETDRLLYDELFWMPCEDETGVLLSFDDDYHNSWKNYFDLFDVYGAKVTFFVQGAYSPFCAEASGRGHDIGFHSLNHSNLTKIPRGLFFEETLSPIDTFRSAGIPLNSFAYPYGISELWMHEELFRFYGILRGYGTTFRLYNPDHIRGTYISSKSIDTIVFPEDFAFNDAVNLMLRAVKFIGGMVLPLTTHDISDTADWGIKPRRLEYLLQTARDLRLRFYRFIDCM